MNRVRSVWMECMEGSRLCNPTLTSNHFKYVVKAMAKNLISLLDSYIDFDDSNHLICLNYNKYHYNNIIANKQLLLMKICIEKTM